MEKRRGRAIALCNFKGGTWKSTIAIHLAAHLQAVLVDMDLTNQDSQRFSDHRPGQECHLTNDAGKVFDLVEQLVSEGRDVVLDCPPHEGPETRIAAMVADAIVVPAGPGPHDIYGLGRTLSLLQQVRTERPLLPVYLVCSEYRRTRAADAFVASLQSNATGQYIGKLWRRVEVEEATHEHKPTWEYRPDSPGAKEMLNLCSFLARKVVPYES